MKPIVSSCCISHGICTPLKYYDITKCLHELFEARVASGPENIAVIRGEYKLTYRELDGKANNVARSLLNTGVKPGSFIGVFLKRSSQVIIAILGILKAGCAYVPLDPEYPVERLKYIIDDAFLSVILTQHLFQERLSFCSSSLVFMDGDQGQPSTSMSFCPFPASGSGDPAYVIYTSGTTGKPKGVCCHHKGAINLLDDMQGRHSLGPKDRCCWWASLNFDASVLEIFSSLLSGAALVIVPDHVRIDAPSLMDWLHDNHITSAFLPPMMISDFQQWVEKNPDKSELRCLVTGVESISHKLMLNILSAVPQLKIINAYGPTETAVCATFYTVDPASTEYENTPVGKPLQNVHIHLLSEEGDEVAQGEIGEICIGGIGVSRGYLNQPELNERLFVADPCCQDKECRMYRSGDLAYALADGNLVFAGRKDFQIKYLGYRIELGEIETVLRRHPNICEAVVMLREDQPGLKRLVAYVVCNKAFSVNTDELQSFMLQTLPVYMIPSAFVFLNKIPMTSNGKTDRNALPSPHRIFEKKSSYVPPRDHIEKMLVEIWEEVLGVHPIGIKEDFFLLGGHSLLAVRLLLRIQEKITSKITLSALFQALTIEELAHRIREDSWRKNISSMVCLQPGVADNLLPPLFFIHVLGTGLKFCRPLVKYLGPERPIYGLSIHLLDKQPQVRNRVEDLARFYIREVKEIYPDGPYLLIGFSFGGLVAFEMARQMRLNGDDIRFVALLDSMLSSGYKKMDAKSRLIKHHEQWQSQGVSYLAKKVFSKMKYKWLVFKQKVNHLYLQTLIRYYKFTGRAGFMSVALKEFAAWNANKEASQHYVPEAYPGKITLFRSHERAIEFNSCIDPQFGWGDVSLGGLEIIDCLGNHVGILEEPYVKTVAKKLRHAIDRALSLEIEESRPVFNNVFFRTVNSEDSDLLKDISLRSIKDSPDSFVATIDQIKGEPDSYWIRLLDFMVDSPDDTIIFAYGDKKCIGYAAVKIDSKDSSLAYLRWMWSDSDLSYKGLNELFLQKTFEWASSKGAERMEILVPERQMSSLRFYESMGFIDTGERAFLRYGSQLTVIRMVNYHIANE